MIFILFLIKFNIFIIFIYLFLYNENKHWQLTFQQEVGLMSSRKRFGYTKGYPKLKPPPLPKVNPKIGSSISMT